MADDNKDTGRHVTLMPLEAGSVTTLNGTTLTAIPLGGQPVGTPPATMVPNGWSATPGWSNPPVVMIPQQQPMILVITDNKKEAASDKEKTHSRVFTRL